MNLEGDVNINAARADVWNFLTDPHKVSSCAPGFESLEIIEPDKVFEAVATVGFGAVKTKFKGRVTFVELDPPNRAVLKAAGTATGSVVEVTSVMELQEGLNGSTDLHWSADVAIFGTIANLATRMMGGLTKKLSGEFFNCVKSQIEQ